MQDVLVLNRNYYAIHVASWQRAMTLLVSGHANVVDGDYKSYSFDDWKELSQMITDNPNGYINTPNFKIAVPEVIALTFYDRLPSREIKFTRKNLYHHYHFKCCYCGHKYDSSKMNLDHVVPRAKGGTTCWENIVLSCIPCNNKKANNTPTEAGMRMHYVPSKPKWRSVLSIGIGLPVKQSWQKFVDDIYWNSELMKG